MIIIDILTQIILASEPDFLFLSATFFAGMGTGTQSGKLLFKQLSEGDSTITITEDSNSVTINSNVPDSNVSIDPYEIVYGTGTGITSSFAKVSKQSELLGVSSIGTLTFSSGWGVCDASGVPTSCNSLIISALNVDNLNYKGLNSNIIGSNKTKICNSCESDIIGSQYSIIKDSSITSIISGISSTSSCSSQTSIISAFNSRICNSCNSSIISGSNNTIDYDLSCYNAKTYGNSIISSNLSSINSSSDISGSINAFNSIISSNTSFIKHTNPGQSGKGNTQSIKLGFNSIISSNNSYICGAIYNKSKLFSCGSDTSIIMSSCSSKIIDSCRSSIISGCCNSIILSLTGSADVMSTWNIRNVSIISGKNNNISLIHNVDGIDMSKLICIANSGIISSKGITFSEACPSVVSQFSVISSSDLNLPQCGNINSSIIGSRSTKSALMAGVCLSAVINSSNATKTGVVWRSVRTVLLNTEDSNIESSRDSFIANGTGNSLTGSCRSVIVSGCCNLLNAGINSVILSGYKNYMRGCNTIIAAGSCNEIRSNSKDSIIFSGFKNCIGLVQNTCQNAIVSSACSYIGSSNVYQKDISTVIIGGCKNCISNSQNSSIIGGCNNCIVGLSQSGIIGSSDKGLTGSFHNTLYVSKLIFDLPAYALGPTSSIGKTSTLTTFWSFRVVNGLIVN